MELVTQFLFLAELNLSARDALPFIKIKLLQDGYR
jgi:hypothetical protein